MHGAVYVPLQVLLKQKHSASATPSALPSNMSALVLANRKLVHSIPRTTRRNADTHP